MIKVSETHHGGEGTPSHRFSVLRISGGGLLKILISRRPDRPWTIVDAADGWTAITTNEGDTFRVHPDRQTLHIGHTMVPLTGDELTAILKVFSGEWPVPDREIALADLAAYYAPEVPA